MIDRRRVFWLYFFLLPLFAVGQTGTGKLTGFLKDAADSTFLPNVAVQLLETGQWIVTDGDGHFSFPSLRSGNYTLLARMLGYQTAQFKVVAFDSSTAFEANTLYLYPLSTELESVTVTAREAKLGSVSQLEGYALKHTQPVSLADVLQLVPGQLAENPELGNVSQFTLRQAPAGSAAQGMNPIGTATQNINALGTALMIDGAPISNNANLQVNTNILNAAPGSLPPFSSVAGRGPDLRAVPADLIESVEVIRGIPSARYGDLSSGAVLVSTRAGVYRPRALVRINPTVRQVSFGAGKKLGNNDAVNAELDLTTALTDPRNDLEQYTRVNLQLGWSDKIANVNLNHRLTLFTTLDETREAPEDDRSRRSNFHRDRGFRFNSQGRWKGEHSFISEVKYVFSLSYQHQESYFQQQITRDIFPVTDALEDTTRPGEYGRSSYLNQTTVDGKPLNAYLRLEAGRYFPDWLGSHRVLWGLEWRHDSNLGEGRQFDPRTPPRQNYSIGDRPRRYVEIPALNQLGLYISDSWNLILGNEKNLLVEWGFRADLMPRVAQPRLMEKGQSTNWMFVPAPRLNTALTLGKDWQIRAGFGIMAKMPTLSYLYPNPVFFDLVNFNYFAPDPAERLVIMTTRKIVPDTSPLRPYQSRKLEMGIDYRPDSRGWDVSISFFNEQVTDAYQVLRQILPIENPKYEAVSFPEGQPPVLSPEPVSVDTFMAAYDLPQNNLAIANQGFDFTVQTPKIEAIRTAFNLTGALLHTRSEQTTAFIDANRAVFSNQFSGRVPVFQAGQGLESLRFNTSLRAIHHIPSLKFIVSGLIQTIWLEQNRFFDHAETPEAFIGRDGQRVELKGSELDEQLLQELGRTIEPARLLWQKRPPLWLFNIRLTKEWASQRGFAFYINNIMNSRQLFTNNLTGFQQTRNQPEFFFGAEVYYRF